MEGRQKRIILYNASPNGYVKKEQLGREHTIFTQDVSGSRSEVCIGVHWPLKMYEKAVGRKATKDEISVHEGVRGVMRNSEHGNLDGSCRVFKYRDRSVAEKKIEATGDKELRKGQMKEKFAELMAAKEESLRMKKKKTAEGEDT